MSPDPPYKKQRLAEHARADSFASAHRSEVEGAPEGSNNVGFEPSSFHQHRNATQHQNNSANPVFSQDGPQESGFTMVDAACLRRELHNIMKSNPIGLDPEGKYVPDDELRRILTFQNIRAALGRDVDDALVSYALQVPKTFATLQLVHREPESRKAALLALQTSLFTDGMLESKDLAVCDPHTCRSDCKHHFPASIWDDQDLSALITERCHFTVPNFNHKIFQYEVQPDQLLPFRGIPNGHRAEGFFSKVRCVEMLFDKQDAIPCANHDRKFIYVALKELQRVSLPSGRLYDIRQEWLREVKAHKELFDVHTHLVQGIAAYRRVAKDSENDKYYVVLEWADGGNLNDFWNKNIERQLAMDPDKNREHIRAMLDQVLGLAKCLEHMHTKTTLRESFVETDRRRASEPAPEQRSSGNPSQPTITIKNPQGTEKEYWRHGDIKPENILRFTGGNDEMWIGTWKLADLGRAQQHDERTALRQSTEREQFRTIMYEPPDLYGDQHTNGHGKISRLFDVWSMGCVIFEVVVWMLHGTRAIARLHDNPAISKEDLNGTPYWIKNGNGRHVLTTRATSWIQHIQQDSTNYSEALVDLVRLVKDKLLVVKLPEDSEHPERGARTNAAGMRKEIELIIQKAAKREDYLFSAANNFAPRPPPSDQSDTSPQQPRSHGGPAIPGNSLMVPGASSSRPAVAGEATTFARSPQAKVYTDTVRTTWQHPDDNFFASSTAIAHHSLVDDILCSGCQEINLMSDELSFCKEDMVANINKCRLCALVSEALARAGFGELPTVRLTRDFDHFVFRHTGTQVTKIFRICRVVESKFPIHARIGFLLTPSSGPGTDLQAIPRGAPNLFNPSMLDTFSKLPNAWLKDCDGHTACAPKRKQYPLPKRLVSVRDVDKPKIVDSATISGDALTNRYVAFSHKWGNICFPTTTVGNLNARREMIPWEELPQSFADAIKVTRALRCDYLWIDSLCINQGAGSDFDEQASSMQDVYSNAYCVVAASKAQGATEGFLLRENGLDLMGSVKKGDLYVSAVTNDFTRDVLGSPLNQRGWVFQERALARRSVFFTETQMYWECGEGIRCETLAKLGQ